MAESHYSRGNVLFDLKRYNSAIASYGRAIALQPDHAAAHCNLGSALKMLKRHDAALASLDRAIALNPGSADARSNRAGDNAFHAVADFTGKSGELRLQVQADGLVVEGDTDGDGLADFSIIVLGALSLQQSDFVL